MSIAALSDYFIIKMAVDGEASSRLMECGLPLTPSSSASWQGLDAALLLLFQNHVKLIASQA